MGSGGERRQHDHRPVPIRWRGYTAGFLGDGAARVAALDAHAAASPGDPIAPLLAQGARAIRERLKES
jgi:hypothetical protein